MEKKIDEHIFQGMQRDLAVSKHPANYLFDARNIRLTQREDGSTLLAVTNEKGPSRTHANIKGTYLGHCVIDKYLVVFSKDAGSDYPDYIERFDLTDIEGSEHTCFQGNLNFQLDCPIEAISSFENNNIQKVYWTDGFNQPRVINIIGEEIEDNTGDIYTGFDFVSTLALEEEVNVKKMKGGGGMFAPGVIQYAFTYYRKYGQETCIFYTTPLLYISYTDRGGSPEDKISTAFKITINNLDKSFDYLRIYSIQRTSLNGTPIVKRLQDISVNDAPNINNDSNNPKYASFTDTGTEGDTIDPTELLYKGGEEIVAQTLEQKDGTLFLGNLEVKRGEDEGNMLGNVKSMVSIASDSRTFTTDLVSSDSYAYGNQLSAVDDNGNSVPCNGFKWGNYYRLGIQLQHKSGKWTDPIFKDDFLEEITPSETNQSGYEVITVPTFTGTLADYGDNTIAQLIGAGYVKVRGVVVLPEAYDRVVQCQGVVNPTLKCDNSPYYQSSWFYRPIHDDTDTVNDTKLVSPKWSGINDELLSYTLNTTTYNPESKKVNIRGVEIQGNFGLNNRFRIYTDIMTLDTPDVEFDTDLWNFDFTGTQYRRVGRVSFSNTLSDIDIQTESPTISNRGSGFIHQSFNGNFGYGIVSGLFYEDFVIDDLNDAVDPGDKKTLKSIAVHEQEKSPVKWLVYPWHKTGSLNNDFNRPVATGDRTAVLKKKIISNLRFADRTYWNLQNFNDDTYEYPKLFSSDQLAILKFGSKLYQGNIDTLLNPDNPSGNYFAFNDAFNADTDITFTADIKWRTGANFESEGDSTKLEGLWHFGPSSEPPSPKWVRKITDVGDFYPDLVVNKEPVRMKYKSSPHLIIDGSKLPLNRNFDDANSDPDLNSLPVVEICTPGDPGSQIPYYRATMFGGNTPDALKANVWLPAGEPVRLIDNSGQAKTSVDFEYSWGDTYFQRYDCLKTYAFTNEDINQVVEIGSFMLETYVNIDGRYDRNRGQLNNLNMSPVNFNLYNPVYSQRDNFFSYHILDASFYENSKFPNQITWSREKQAGADIDPWTSITLASTYDMDGSKGEITSLNLWKDTLFCFQNKGISSILFNSRVQIPTSDGIPIEISNSYKVDGYRYLSDGVGCTNKWTIKETPACVYFVDSMSHHLYSIGEGLTDITLAKNMGSWFNDNGKLIQRTTYDDVHHDIYLIKAEDEALCYNEQLGEFTSFMNYEGVDLMEAYQGNTFALKFKNLHQMFAGDYNYFFGKYQPWSITFVSNGAAAGMGTLDKIFSNIEYRMDMFDGDTYNGDSTFDWVRVWNEYQDTGEYPLRQLKNGMGYKTSEAFPNDSMQKKYKIWRIQIPRALKNVGGQLRLGIDRIRNPWCKITLGKKNDYQEEYKKNQKAILHDLGVYFYV